jgi:hypothetical protein
MACTASVRSRSSRRNSSNGVRGKGPHARIRSSIPPCARTSAATRSGASRAVRSTHTVWANSGPPSSVCIAASFVASRAVRITRSLRARSARAMRTPSLPVAPTTSTRRGPRTGGGADGGAEMVIFLEVPRLRLHLGRIHEIAPPARGQRDHPRATARPAMTPKNRIRGSCEGALRLRSSSPSAARSRTGRGAPSFRTRRDSSRLRLCCGTGRRAPDTSCLAR